MSTKDAQKAAGFVQQLNEARCNGNWPAVADLARRVEKYAPSRTCLLLASRAGASTAQDSSAAACARANEQYGAQLAEAIKAPGTSPNEVLDGTVCRASILLGMGDAQGALDVLPPGLVDTAPPARGTGQEAWSTTCVIISFLVRGLALESTGRDEEAAKNYRLILSYLSALVQLPSLAPELRRWTEELVCHTCLFYSQDRPGQPANFGQAMAVFHILSRLLDTQSGNLSTHLGTLSKDRPRQVWKAYYAALTTVINQGLVYHPSPTERDHDVPEHRGLLEDHEYFASRVQQRKDLKTVELSYEVLLMIETYFPKAGESNAEVCEFVENAMANWRALCGPSWTERELGEGGKTAVARRALEVLYRAATKTFHSPQILRHLFTVHAYLSEFDMAFRSLDSYLGIMTKGKARVEKSGTVAQDLDDDEQLIAFVAEAMRTACRYGPLQAADRALALGATLAQWLKTGSTSSLADAGADKHLQRAFKPVASSKYSAETTALASRAIGLSLANWSRTTYEPASRTVAQELATAAFEQALNQGLPDSQCTETLYSLAVLFAEARRIPEAIALVRRALRSDDEAAALAQPSGVSTQSRLRSSSRLKSGPVRQETAFSRTRKMLPVWHLLAQLLSTCEELEGAASACKVAFQSLVELCGPRGQDGVLSGGGDRPNFAAGLSEAAVEALDHYEKQTLVEIQMTSIAIIGLDEGPSAAVNASDDLLALYAKLYGAVSDNQPAAQSATRTVGSPPKSSHGSIRSIFHRHRHRDRETNHKLQGQADGAAAASADTVNLAVRPSTSTMAPSVQVTNHDGELNGGETNEKVAGETNKLQRKRTASLRSRKSKEPVAAAAAASQQLSEKLEVGQQTGAGQPMPEIPHNMPHNKAPPPPGHASQPPQQDTRLPVPMPAEDDAPIATHFDVAQEQRQKRALLVKVWLFIAQLYREAEQFDESQDALEEAMRVVEQLELSVATKDASVKKLRERGWGNGASVDELWADAYAERGDLLQASERANDAAVAYETALSHHPDHARGITGLADVLLDKYSKQAPLERRQQAALIARGAGSSSTVLSDPATDSHADSTGASAGASTTQEQKTHQQQQTPGELDTPALYRMAARDRACGLLAALTRLPAGWDDAEAWLQYARALQDSGQRDRAKAALWWTLELEGSGPVRHWRHVGPGGYVL